MIDRDQINFRFSKEDVVYFSFLFFLIRQYNVSKTLNNKLINLKTVHVDVFANNFPRNVKYFVPIQFLYFTKTLKIITTKNVTSV